MTLFINYIIIKHVWNIFIGHEILTFYLNNFINSSMHIKNDIIVLKFNLSPQKQLCGDFSSLRTFYVRNKFL